MADNQRETREKEIEAMFEDYQGKIMAEREKALKKCNLESENQKAHRIEASEFRLAFKKYLEIRFEWRNDVIKFRDEGKGLDHGVADVYMKRCRHLITEMEAIPRDPSDQDFFQRYETWLFAEVNSTIKAIRNSKVLKEQRGAPGPSRTESNGAGSPT